jgi:organic radical activating enzyme
MNKKARVLITRECNRKCPNCCSEYNTVMKGMKEISSIDALKDYDQIMITGGEPMLLPEAVRVYSEGLKRNNPDCTIYLYTALYKSNLYDIMDIIDGIHYTLHIHSTPQDIANFNSFQELARLYPDKSIRAYIDPAVQLPVTIYPWIYKRLEVKPWILEGACPLPEGEDLFLLS